MLFGALPWQHVKFECDSSARIYKQGPIYFSPQSCKIQFFYQSMRPKSGLKFPRPLNNYFMDIFVGTLFVLDFGIFLGYVTKKEYIYNLGFNYNI